MSFIKSEDTGKWINALLVIGSAIAGFIITQFLEQMSIWFDLEAKIPNFILVSQFVGVLIFIATFVFTFKNEKAQAYLNDVYNELLKVVWPTKDATVKMTLGLVVALVVVAGLFVSIDFIFKKLLSFIY